MAKKKLTCIICPLGCSMEVTHSKSEEFAVEGHQCKRGKTYAVEEYTNPTRMVTSTVAIHNASLPRLPVKTSKPIPKDLIFPCIRELDRVKISGPVKMGEVIIKNLLGTGIDVVASRSLK
jgi:CxxC motif-containing protein